MDSDTNKNRLYFPELHKIKIYASISKLPRFYHAKVIELVDKLSSVLAFMSIGLSYTFDSIFAPSNTNTHFQSTLKESRLFKAWHREVEDTFDDLNDKVKEFLSQIALLVYKESNEDPNLREMVRTMTDPEFEKVVYSEINHKNNEILSINLFEIGKLLLPKTHYLQDNETFQKEYGLPHINLKDKLSMDQTHSYANSHRNSIHNSKGAPESKLK